MAHERIGYFVVPADELEELVERYERWRDSPRDDGIKVIQILTNQLYRFAQAQAVSQWRYDAHPLDYRAQRHVLAHLGRKCEAFENTVLVMPEDCPAVARAVDALVARRGGQDALIRHMTKLTLGEIPLSMIREVYVAFRTALATAVELDAALVCTHYQPGAERELADERAREAARRAKIEPEPTPAQREAWDKWWEERKAFKPDESTIPPWDWARTHHRLYMVPEPYISDIMAMSARVQELYEESYDNFDKCLTLREKAETIGFEEWERWLRLDMRAQTTTWEYLETTLGEFRPGCVLAGAIALEPARVRALFSALQDWQAHVGGRDAAVAYLVEKSHGHHLALTRQTYDAVFALYQYGAEHGCGLIDSPLYDMT